MKKTIIGITLMTSLLLAACGNTDNEIVATTAYGDITKSGFYEQMKEIAGTTLLEQVVIDKILTDQYEVSDKEIEEQLETYKEMYGESFESALATNGYTEETFKDTIRFQLLQQKAMEDVEVTEEEIETYYEQGKYELHTRHILVETEEEAQQLYEQISEGGDFEAIAKENSQDSETAENGGDQDWLSIADMETTFADTAYALETGEVSEPVESTLGYEIIQLVDEREVKDYASLEEQKEEIKKKMIERIVANTEWETVEARLLKEARVTIKDADFKDAFSATLNEEE
ncbi:MAG: peptidylprolyl isomerase [Solibacillus sp.]|uniref:peptidylprolyl isomerase n=1 Tax=Solibacillus sp. TaxID=1909654 RepID=UPI003314DBC7